MSLGDRGNGSLRPNAGPQRGDPIGDPIGDAASAATRRILLLRVGSLALIFLGSVVLARSLGPEGRGAHGFFVASVALLSGTFGLSGAIGGYVLSTRHGVASRDLAVNATWIAGVVGIGAVGALAGIELLTDALPPGLSGLDLWPLHVAVGVAGFALNAYQLQLALARGRALAGAVLGFAPYTLAGIAYVGFAVVGAADLATAVWVFALAPLGIAVLAGFVRPPLEVVALGPPRVSLLIRTIREGLRTYPGELAGTLHRRIDVVLLGLLSPAASVGIYVVAYQTVEPILVLATASGATILALGHGRHEVESGAVTARLIRETFVAGSILALAAAVAAPTLVPLVYGEAFADSVGPLVILLPAVVFLAVGRIATADLMRRNLLEWMAGISLVALVANVVLNILLIPGFGATGAAMASLVSYTAHAILAVAVDGRAGRFSVRSVVPGPGDVAAVVRAWNPVALARRAGRRGT